MARHPFQNALKRLLIAMSLLCLVIGLAAVTLYLLASYRPKGYSPAQLTPAQQQAVLDQGMKKVEEFHNSLTTRDEFIFEITDQFVNYQLACEDNRDLVEKFAGTHASRFSRPQFVFDRGILSVLGEIHEEPIRGIVTVSIKPQVGESGVSLTLLPLKLGSVALPARLRKKALEPLGAVLEKGVRDYRRRPGKDLFDQSFGELIGKLPALLQEGTITVAPVLYPFEDITARITGIEIDGGVLRLHMATSRRERAADGGGRP